MNFTKNTIQKLELINTLIIDYSKMPVKLLNKTELRKYFDEAKRKNKHLNKEFNEYGSIQNMTLYAYFFDEYSKDVKFFQVSRVYSIYECFAFELCKDNFLTLQKSRQFIQKINTL